MQGYDRLLTDVFYVKHLHKFSSEPIMQMRTLYLYCNIFLERLAVFFMWSCCIFQPIMKLLKICDTASS